MSSSPVPQDAPQIHLPQENVRNRRLSGSEKSEPDAASTGSSGTSREELEAHGDELQAFDVFCLIVNKMIGTGIYNVPSSVLILTANKKVAMTLWVLGLLYTIVSMLIYLGYSAVLPYTGGELVYVDEISSEMKAANTTRDQRSDTNESQARRTARLAPWRKRIWAKVFGDGLLAYTVYSILFVAFFNSSTNALQVGRETLIAIRPEEDPQMDVLRLIAVVALSLLCLIQYWSSKAGRTLNRWSAVLKILFLLIVFIAGAARTNKHLAFQGNGFVQCAPVRHRNQGVEVAKAMLLVIFSFEGWENATFVAGEISPENQGALRKGFMWAVTVVGCLYLSIVAVFLYAIPYTPVAVQFVPMLFGNGKSAYQAWAVIIAISSLGSMNSIIYTFSRIKQCIGHGNILPWSRFWASDSPDIEGESNSDMSKSPKGGLWLHWIMSVILIAVSAALPSVLESLALPGLLQTYTHCVILMFVALGALRLPALAIHLKEERDARNNRPSGAGQTGGPLDWRIWHTNSYWRWLLAVMVILYAAANLMVVVVTPIKPFISQDGIDAKELHDETWSVSQDNKTLSCKGKHGTTINFGIPITPDRVAALDGRILPAATFGALFIGMVYYLLLFKWPKKAAGVFPVVLRRSRYKLGREEVRRFGSRRTVTYNHEDHERTPSFWYWLFGGRSQYEVTDQDNPLITLKKKKWMHPEDQHAALSSTSEQGGQDGLTEN